jgi:UDP-2,3-diacylglucosamine pyrophosphatase LpxH
MARHDIIFLSDLHLDIGTRDKTKHKYEYHWVSDDHLRNLEAFLEHLVQTNPKDGTLEIVCAGDIFDNWVHPIDTRPPSIIDIMQASRNAEVVKRLRRLATEQARVTYLPGNHDMTVTAGDIAQTMPEVTAQLGWMGDGVYQNGCIRAEHGNAPAMFNAPDIVHGLPRPLPLGYAITRLEATRQARTGQGGRDYLSYLDDVMNMLATSEELAAAVFDAVMEETNVTSDTTIVMPDGREIALSEIRDAYKNLYDDWCNAHGGFGAGPRAIMHEFRYLDDYADQLCKRDGTRIVVLGHSHQSELEKDRTFGHARIYANCGAWCKYKDGAPVNGTFVHVRIDDLSNTRKKYTVTRKEWDGAAERSIGEDEEMVV